MALNDEYESHKQKHQRTPNCAFTICQQPGPTPMAHQPQHTESTLLTRYLLPPSSLPTILPYKSFVALHKPASSNPETQRTLKQVYRDLQFQRTIDIDTVRLNIDRECARGQVHKAKLRRTLREELGEDGKGRKTRKRKREDEEEESIYISDSEGGRVSAGGYDALNDPREREIEARFLGPTGAVLSSTGRYHTTASLLEAMQQSVQDLESEFSEFDRESEQVLGEMRETVGGLSDLRYGKFGRISGVQGEDGAVEGEVVEALKEFTNAIERKSGQIGKRQVNG